MDAGTRPNVDAQLLRRVCAEFREMPGLRLTCGQAQRLWRLEQRACCEVLDYLVSVKFLRADDGVYSRLAEGQ